MTEEQRKQCQEIIQSACMSAIGVGMNTIVMHKDIINPTQQYFLIETIYKAMIMSIAKVLDKNITEEQAAQYMEEIITTKENESFFNKEENVTGRIERLGWLTVAYFLTS